MKETKMVDCNDLYLLTSSAERVLTKYGTYEDGTQKDWTEWTDLRDAIVNFKNKFPNCNVNYTPYKSEDIYE